MNIKILFTAIIFLVMSFNMASRKQDKQKTMTTLESADDNERTNPEKPVTDIIKLESNDLQGTGQGLIIHFRG